MTQIITPADDAWLPNVESEHPAPGMYADVPTASYRPGWKLPSQSLLKKAIGYTPRHAQYEQAHPSGDTTDKAMGTALHARVLEPEHFDDLILLGPVNEKTHKCYGRTTQAWAEMAEANPLATLVSQSEMDAALFMADSLLAEPEMRFFQRLGYETEVSVVADLEGTFPEVLHADMGPFAMRVKARLDIWIEKMGWVVDLKKTTDARQYKFNKSIDDFGYHFQAAFYKRVLAALGVELKRWVFAIVESKPPWVAVLRDLDPAAEEQGAVQASKALALWASCLDRDEYPAFPPGIGRATLPGYSLSGNSQSDWEDVLNEEYRTTG